MKKHTAFKRIIAAVLLAALTAMSLCGCGSGKGEIKSLIAEFEDSCNKLDIDDMLDCIKPSIADKIELAAEIAGLFSDKASDEIMEGVAEFLMNDTTLNAGDFFSSIKIKTGNIEVDGENATVDAEVEYTMGDEDYNEEAVFKCVYEADDWYISSFSFK